MQGSPTGLVHLATHFPECASAARPREVEVRDVVDAIAYIRLDSTDCPWRQLPNGSRAVRRWSGIFYAWRDEKRRD